MTKTPTHRVDLGSHQLVYFEDVDDDSAQRLYVRAELARELAAELEATQQTIYARNREIGAILDRAESAERTLAEERKDAFSVCIQLCRDYSSRNGSVFIKDVESALEALVREER